MKSCYKHPEVRIDEDGICWKCMEEKNTRHPNKITIDLNKVKLRGCAIVPFEDFLKEIDIDLEEEEKVAILFPEFGLLIENVVLAMDYAFIVNLPKTNVLIINLNETNPHQIIREENVINLN